MTHSLRSGQATQYLYDGRKAFLIRQLPEEAWTPFLGNTQEEKDVRDHYEHVGLLYRCVHIRADSLAQVPWAIVDDRTDDTIWAMGEKRPPSMDWARRLPWFLRNTEAALTLGSKAFWFKSRNRVKVLDLKWLAPMSMMPFWDEKKGLTHFIRNVNGRDIDFPVEDIVYIWNMHPQHETLLDVAPAQAALASTGVIYSVDTFVSGFFERGAIKATILTVQGNPPPAERERLKAWWARFFSGVKKAWGAEVVSAEGVKPVVVGEGIQELSNTDLTGEKRFDIATTLGVPHSMVLGDAANFAVSEQDEQNFYNSTILPECDLIAEQVNEQLFLPMGLRLEFRPQEMDIFQTDENKRADALVKYTTAGFKLSMAVQILGIDLPEGVTPESLDPEPQPALAQFQVIDAQPRQLPGPTVQDEQRHSEMRRFRAWAKKRIGKVGFDSAGFESELLSNADKAVIVEELEGDDVVDAPFPVDQFANYP